MSPYLIYLIYLYLYLSLSIAHGVHDKHPPTRSKSAGAACRVEPAVADEILVLRSA
jgi:hypothetical protein